MPKIRVAAGDLYVSLPNIPDIKPKISLERCKTIELLLSAIALEEISLSHLLNAEAEKLQYFEKANILYQRFYQAESKYKSYITNGHKITDNTALQVRRHNFP